MDIDDIETPAVLVDLDIVERNLAKLQDYCDRHGIANRPHIKTHKLTRFAKAQIAAGAAGITCQKLSEAEVMADAGFDDILITYNIIGLAKLARLKALARRCRVSVCADSKATIAGLAGAFNDPDVPLPVLVECDTGAGRCGVVTPEQAAELAGDIAAQPGLAFKGLMTYPPAGQVPQVQAWLAEAVALCQAAGHDCTVVSSGGTPDLYTAHQVTAATEHRAGTYIYNDRSLVSRGACGTDDVVLTVLATVVSAPTPRRAIIDAGSKVLTSDLMGMTGFGSVVGHPEIAVDSLSEEHGRLDLAAVPGSLNIGQRIQIIPNHACPVSNVVGLVHLVRGGRVEKTMTVDARGCIT